VEFRTRKVIQPGDLNPLDTLFGGRLLEWVDEECLIYCDCQLRHANLASKFISEFNFLRPARQNDVTEIGVETVKLGRTSITVRRQVQHKQSREMIPAVDRIVFVALDRRGLSIVHGLARRSGEPHQPTSANASWPRWLGGRPET
jgi:acyl-CoA hydrolase